MSNANPPDWPDYSAEVAISTEVVDDTGRVCRELYDDRNYIAVRAVTRRNGAKYACIVTLDRRKCTEEQLSDPLASAGPRINEAFARPFSSPSEG